MEISILLTILLIFVSLGGLFLQEGKICLVMESQINGFITVKHNLKSALFRWTGKFVFRGVYLLNTVILMDVQKAAPSVLIQLQNHNFRG
ncbi:hypothetical protein [Falsiporphyromonas endometrii]|uniref:ATP synthase F0 subunit 8 n=1 Tax=Falsiporphyromonas endometrii TaxID=1387297 RepID=A0ABV9K741_9PORP